MKTENKLTKERNIKNKINENRKQIDEIMKYKKNKRNQIIYKNENRQNRRKNEISH